MLLRQRSVAIWLFVCAVDAGRTNACACTSHQHHLNQTRLLLTKIEQRKYPVNNGPKVLITHTPMWNNASDAFGKIIACGLQENGPMGVSL